MALLLGCIADDMTGATDLALMLASHGMPAIQYIGIPDDVTSVPEAAAAVIALKTRSIEPHNAVEISRSAALWLENQGAHQLFFKYCSTFDSTYRGNIGPVAEALLDVAGGDMALVCPAFPANGRSVYMGHLFVGEQLLSDSGMRSHPVTPMTDANLTRLLKPQVQPGTKIGLLSFTTVAQGPAAVRARLKTLAGEGVRFVIADAIRDDDLITLGAAASGMALITGGSGIAMGLPENFRRSGHLKTDEGSFSLQPDSGPVVVLSGSCSPMTQAQVEAVRRQWPCLKLDPVGISRGQQSVETILQWAATHLDAGSLLIYSTASTDQVTQAQQAIGQKKSMALLESTLAKVASALVERGVNKLIVAGGETSGAVIEALGIKALRIGPAIAPGVPWVRSEPDGLLLALKSGNFGDEQFFIKAVEMVQ